MTSQRLGLVLIAGALFAIATIGTILTLDIKARDTHTIRADGAALARLLAGFSYQELAPGDGSHSVIEILRSRIARSPLAYAAVFDHNNSLRSYIGSAPEVGAMALDTAALSTGLIERDTVAADGQRVIEFVSPLVDAGQIAGSIRVGFIKPDFGLVLTDLPLLARLALPVSLLIPLFYYVMRREMRPLQTVSARLDEIAARLSDPIELQPSADMQGFIGNFERFMQAAEARQREAQTRQADLVMQQRLIVYEKSRVESSLQSIPDGIMVVGENGQVAFINDNLALLLKVTRDMVVDKPIAEWCREPSIATFLKRLNSVNGLCRVETLEVPPGAHCDKDLAISAVPLFSPRDASETFGSVVVFRDITTEVHARSARDDFVAKVAHEIKNPLNVINMQAETLAEFGADNDELRVTAVNVIQDEVERLSHMVGDLLNITQIEAGSLTIQRSPVKLRELIEDAFVTTMRGGEARAIVPRLELPRHLSTVLADKDLLRLALNNVLTNAIKYNRDGGTVTLRASENDDTVIIEISDEGVGIAAADQGRIFEKFFRAESSEARAREGHGLGLALAKQVIDLHYGRMEVESELGVGTTFTIMLEKDINQLQEAV